VGKFLLELYVAKSAGLDVERLAMRARDAADEVSTEGRPVRCLRSILVPEDETCFLLFEAAAADDVRLAAERAELAFGRVTDALADEAGDATNGWPTQNRSTNE
jgi:hypothetical protein